MKADLASKLQRAMRGGLTPKTGVTGVTGVAGVAATCVKSLKLQCERQLRMRNDKVPNGEILGVAGGVAAQPEPGEAWLEDTGVALEERKAMAAGGVLEPYLDAWTRLQSQKPSAVTDTEWRRAIDAAGQFLDAWGAFAVEFQWTPGELLAEAAEKCQVVLDKLMLALLGLGNGKHEYIRQRLKEML